jgi:hypothetical protein
MEPIRLCDTDAARYARAYPFILRILDVVEEAGPESSFIALQVCKIWMVATLDNAGTNNRAWSVYDAIAKRIAAGLRYNERKTSSL